MIPRLLIFISSAATVLTTGACGTGIYHSPIAQSFVTIDLQVGFPVNTTTPGGVVGSVPIRGGSISGQFNGHLVSNISSEIEHVLPLTSGEYTSVSSQWIFENEMNEHILTTLSGLTTYTNNALHGLGTAVLATEIKEFYWVNSASFLIEWQGDFNTGKAQFEFFQITTGGRVDGQPITALLPLGGK
ncbi:uncharacterized protein TRIVIDRAFT_32329 [Trichoderma virens Gv29-8]|uniref:Lipoprotein n=1 Tax=Hypocrea virens (strain Gv29-8 / FGSC 10586) TaxID=413071 RepID=G9MK46_HYPVG|nr:uncharacterized protein TRIVIDRAFT_32329 [Trichoderma virens Gv29-8]EHK25851.1 hypothetical protein TRIVIDRAFT_32329 [Trichoderma virens Gv29-8]UKZ48325.1 hypothetical protein TrVGV298_002548 [Trichoderma virens]